MLAVFANQVIILRLKLFYNVPIIILDSNV
jgi:hypothetical protein